MSRSKLGLLGLCAVVLGVMAMSASAAQAALSWLVLNAADTTATELKALVVSENDSQHLTLLTTFFGIKVALTCTGLALKNVNLEAGGKLTVGGSAVFTGCEFYGKGSLEEPLGCKIHTAGQPAGTLESGKVKGALASGKVAGIEPEVAGGSLMSFLTEKCVIGEVISIKGVLYLEDCEAQPESKPCISRSLTHQVKHLVQPSPSTSLTFGGAGATIDGSVWVRLAGAHAGLKWSAMDV